MNFYQATPDAIKALSTLETQVQGSGLEQSLIESEQRLYLLNAWREAPVLCPR
jgi:hypothetical protein